MSDMNKFQADRIRRGTPVQGNVGGATRANAPHVGGARKVQKPTPDAKANYRKTESEGDGATGSNPSLSSPPNPAEPGHFAAGVGFGPPPKCSKSANAGEGAEGAGAKEPYASLTGVQVSGFCVCAFPRTECPDCDHPLCGMCEGARQRAAAVAPVAGGPLVVPAAPVRVDETTARHVLNGELLFFVVPSTSSRGDLSIRLHPGDHTASEIYSELTRRFVAGDVLLVTKLPRELADAARSQRKGGAP